MTSYFFQYFYTNGVNVLTLVAQLLGCHLYQFLYLFTFFSVFVWLGAPEVTGR